MIRRFSIAAVCLSLCSTGMAATLIGTGQTIDLSGNTTTLNAASPNALNLITNNGGGSYTIAASPPNNDFYMSYTTSNIDPDAYDYLQIDFASFSLADTANFQLFISDDNNFVSGELSYNAATSSSTSAFSLVFDLSASANWTALQDSNPTGGSDVDGIRLDIFNGLSFRGEIFTISTITFGDTLTAVPEPSSALLGILGLFPLLRRKR